MEKSRILVRDYVRAGYTKIHLDTSMTCADDDRDHSLPTDLIAARAVDLARVAEETYRDTDKVGPHPSYIIGAEVPPPGGVDDEEGILNVSTPQAAEETISTTREAFRRLGLEEAWERVINPIWHHSRSRRLRARLRLALNSLRFIKVLIDQAQHESFVGRQIQRG